jgi:ABC-2 type transport system ATP-binding protein
MKLVISSLTKTYSTGTRALFNINLTIQEGMFGLLGPNGAGKSTLMRILATLQEPDTGTVYLDDLDVLKARTEVRKILGYLPQEFGLYPRISALEMLNHLAVLKGITGKGERREIVESLLNKTNLWTHRKKYLGTFSGGMKQRFGIAQALLANPRLLIVDEPTAGLDPAERNRFLNLLAELGENTIVILSTHIVEDVAQLCTNMAIIQEGELLFTGNPQYAMAMFKGKIWCKFIERSELQHYRDAGNVVSEKLSGGKLEIHVLAETPPDSSFLPVPVTLEDVYFAHLLEAQSNKDTHRIVV